MKIEIMPCLVQLEKEELQQLCCEVKETVANDIAFREVKPEPASFGLADLWSMQRKMKTAAGRWSNKHRSLFVRG